MPAGLEIQNGFDAKGSGLITGSLSVSSGITGSLQGTSSFALTASYALNASAITTGDLATAQARRTTGYTLTAIPATITFNTTDTENQPSVVSHDNTNTDRIYVYSSGLYSIHYHCDVAQGTTVNDFEFSAIKNVSTILSGSLIAGKNSSTDKMTVGVTTQEILASGDYITLAARYVASSGGIVNNAVLSVTKMEGVVGPSGSTAAAGTTGEVQYNNAGALAGAANVEIAGDNLQLVSTTDPSAPSAGNLILYSKDIAGRQMPKWIGPSGIDTPFQSNIMFNNVSVIGPGGGTTVGVLSCTVTNVGTISNPNIASTNLKTQTRRIVNTSAAAAGSLASTRVASLECWRGNAAGLGGFFVVARFGLTTLQTGMRMFVGLTDTATTAPTNIDPTTSTTPGKIGMAINASTGNWNLVHNITGTSPTVIALGASYPVDTTSLYEMILFAKPNDTVVTYRITNLSTAAQTSGTLSTNLPASATPLGRTCWATNNAATAAVAWDLSRFSLESDY